MSLLKGLKAESQALKYLKEKGLTLKNTNFKCKLGEIDLIMQDGEYIVFVEVRQRKSGKYGGAAESVTIAKQKKIKRTAALYLLTNKYYDKYPVRFDVVTLQGSPPQMSWLKSAFM